MVTFDRPGRKAFYSLDERVYRIDLSIGDSAARAGVRESARRILALRSAIPAEKPDVAVGFMHSMFIPLSIALLGTAIPVIGSEHIVPEHYRGRPIEKILLLISASLMARITVVSESIKARYSIPIRRRMIVVPNPVVKASKTEAVRDTSPIYTMLNVGRLDPQKDQETLLRAFSLVARKYPNWRVKLIGDGPMRHQLQTLVHDLGLSHCVDMPGITDKIDAEYSSADLFVMSSRYESFGLVTAEAMSHGLPVIGFSDCPGTNELIEHEITGSLVDPGLDRVESLANAMDHLMDRPALRNTLGERAKQRIENYYGEEIIYDIWERLLYNVSGRT